MIESVRYINSTTLKVREREKEKDKSLSGQVWSASRKSRKWSVKCAICWLVHPKEVLEYRKQASKQTHKQTNKRQQKQEKTEDMQWQIAFASWPLLARLDGGGYITSTWLCQTLVWWWWWRLQWCWWWCEMRKRAHAPWCALTNIIIIIIVIPTTTTTTMCCLYRSKIEYKVYIIYATYYTMLLLGDYYDVVIINVDYHSI